MCYWLQVCLAALVVSVPDVNAGNGTSISVPDVNAGNETSIQKTSGGVVVLTDVGTCLS